MKGSVDENLQTGYSKSPYENLSANDKLNGETVMSQIQPSHLHQQMQAKDSLNKFSSGMDVNNANSGSTK